MPFSPSSQYAEVLRLVTTASISIAVTGAAIYSQLAHPAVNSPLIGWAGMVVGTFVGHSIGMVSAQRAASQALAVQKQAANGHPAPTPTA